MNKSFAFGFFIGFVYLFFIIFSRKQKIFRIVRTYTHTALKPPASPGVSHE